MYARTHLVLKQRDQPHQKPGAEKKQKKPRRPEKSGVTRQMSRQYLKASTNRMLPRRLKQEFWQLRPKPLILQTKSA